MMITKEVEIKEKNCHAPDDKLRKYMSEKAYCVRRKGELNLRMETKKKLSKKEQEELDHIEVRTGTLKNNKTEILNDIIFPAMANLTFFFDAIERFPELEPIFKENIMDLLGVRRLNPKANNYAFMFEKLVACMLNLGSTDERMANDYTIRLVNILQELITLKLHGPKILDTPRTTGLVHQDIERARCWTELLALRIPDMHNFAKSPHRTFTYDTKELMEWKRKND